MKINGVPTVKRHKTHKTLVHTLKLMQHFCWVGQTENLDPSYVHVVVPSTSHNCSAHCGSVSSADVKGNFQSHKVYLHFIWSPHSAFVPIFQLFVAWI